MGSVSHGMDFFRARVWMLLIRVLHLHGTENTYDRTTLR